MDSPARFGHLTQANADILALCHRKTTIFTLFAALLFALMSRLTATNRTRDRHHAGTEATNDAGC